MLSTAHPAKFPETIDQALGFEPALPEPLAALWHKDISVAPLAPEAGALKAVLLANG